ncbi:hypothetical protein JQM83_11265 [Parabacteroides distasonis]|nr:hypothetical protein [Parabacteroides distasonis]
MTDQVTQNVISYKFRIESSGSLSDQLHGSVRDTLQVGSSLLPIHQAGNRTGLSDTGFPLSWLCQLMTG